MERRKGYFENQFARRCFCFSQKGIETLLYVLFFVINYFIIILRFFFFFFLHYIVIFFFFYYCYYLPLKSELVVWHRDFCLIRNIDYEGQTLVLSVKPPVMHTSHRVQGSKEDSKFVLKQASDAARMKTMLLNIGTMLFYRWQKQVCE